MLGYSGLEGSCRGREVLAPQKSTRNSLPGFAGFVFQCKKIKRVHLGSREGDWGWHRAQGCAPVGIAGMEVCCAALLYGDSNRHGAIGGSRGAGEKLCQEGGGHGTVTQGCGHGPELPELTVLG